MFQIGQQLAEQRRRRGLSLAECEAQTRIRARFLGALEADCGQDLLDPAYVRIFLRDYASYLGLDAEMLVTELDEQTGAGDHLAEHRLVPIEAPSTLRSSAHGAGLRRAAARAWEHSPPRAVWVGAGLAGAVGLLIALGATGGGSSGVPASSLAPAGVATTPDVAPPPATMTAPVVTRPIAPTVAPGSPVPTAVVLRLTGAGTYGAYVRLQRGSAAGSVVYSGTIAPGAHVQVTVTGPLWMRVGWVPSLVASLGGHTLALAGGTANFMVTPTSVHPTT